MLFIKYICSIISVETDILHLKDLKDYWCRELCTYYPYGLNSNVRGVGNISKQHGLVVHTLFHRSLENEMAISVEERSI